MFYNLCSRVCPVLGRSLHVISRSFWSCLVSQDFSILLFWAVDVTHDDVGCNVTLVTVIRELTAKAVGVCMESQVDVSQVSIESHLVASECNMKTLLLVFTNTSRGGVSAIIHVHSLRIHLAQVSRSEIYSNCKTILAW